MDNMKTALAIIQNSKNEVLIVDRKQEEQGKNDSILNWSFPGGEIAENQTPEDAVIKQTLDQVGYEIRVKELINERQHPDIPADVYYFACEINKSAPNSD